MARRAITYLEASVASSSEECGTRTDHGTVDFKITVPAANGQVGILCGVVDAAQA